MSIDVQNIGTRAVLNVNGSIGGDVLSSEFQDKLNALDEGVSEIVVNITTRGGSVIDGHAMFGMLRETGKRIVTTVIGGAYSAGAVLSQAGDERRMHSNALFMLHGASGGGGSMTADQHRGALDMIEKANAVIAETLAQRTGQPVARMTEYLNGRDNWMTAREAKAAGFIDTIVMDKTPNSEFVQLVPEDILNEIGACLPHDTTTTEEPVIMADTKTVPTPATSKEIKAACVGCSADFVLAQLENEATIDQVKDAWIKQLTSDRTEAEAKAVAEAAKNETLANELEAAKKGKSKSGVAPVSAGSSAGGSDTDAVAVWNELIASEVKSGVSRQQAVRNCVVNYGSEHAAFLAAHNASHR